ncbi:Non-reducing polyketide synthase fsr1 [Fusarium oxysporum f. sp. rapae]|uniref:Non-reducing polyketide synthase fsr1 n=1 Tax=Fusarium oxysporum f. sp. rapae TaxID=485398 RepID=A0A8J5PBL7_FUSOX|nr:Non-reducing polyketide synthase fsr1 [Fusarium oxysporum f. sp. rapae]
MASHMKLYLFGDQAFEVQPHLQHLLQKRDNLFLHDFLNQSYNALRAELFKIPYSIRKDLPRFTCQEDLLLWDQSGPRCVALDMAMTTLYQLGTFISQAGISSYDAQNTRVVGLCTGAFAAAAVSCSSFTADLIPMAVSSVVAAFRTGLLVTDAARRVNPSQELNRSWALVVPGQKAAKAVQEFWDANDGSVLTSMPYISAYAPNGITVSGPPQRLSDLTHYLASKSITSKPIPIYGAYHAPHLYSQKDTRRIVDGLMLNKGVSPSEQIPLLSSTGSKPEERSFATLLEDAIAQALLHPLRWSSIFDDIQAAIETTGSEQFSVQSIGSNAEHLIYTALKKTSLRHLVPETTVPSQPTSVPSVPDTGTNKPKLAIVAMSGRFPGAKDNEAYWDLLYKGLDVHKPVPSLRWDQQTHVDPTGAGKNTSATPFGCWLDDPSQFDARFFNISPREAPQIDPAQRLALMTAYEAIEQAGIVPDATPSTRPDRVGIFYGVTSNDWMETNSAQNIDTYYIPGGNRAFIPGRINYFFKFSGPSYAIDTACSSSLAGIHLACNALWQGDVDTAIAGGTNVLTNPDYHAGLDRGHFLSRTGNCKTFDDGADGYCRGEGVATIIIKRLDDAIAENDPILGVVLGAYTNHSAESESITRPHVGAQRVIFNKILNEAAVDPYSVSYVEMHGTGTQAGDATEMSSVLETFAPPLTDGKLARTDSQKLYIGSAKSNIGHGEAASGVCSVVKVLQMLKKDTIVPHCGIKNRINHRFPTDLEQRNVRIALEPTQWKKGTETNPRRVFVNNFSAAGGNSALLIQDAPPRKQLIASNDSRVQFPIAITAKSGVSLQGNMRSMLKFLSTNSHISLAELSYTTTARRIHHQHRVLVPGATPEEICSKIETALQNNTGVTRPKAAPKVVFTFTGQGAQYPGMGKQLFEENEFVRNELLSLDQIAQNLGFPSMLPFIQSDEPDVGKFAPSLVQLASVCLQITLSKLWVSWGIAPTAVVGHSLGEYAALNVAGVLSDTDTLFLVGGRAQLLEQKCTRGTHAMLVVKGSQEEIAETLKGQLYETACINSPIETVLAGPNEQIASVKEQLTAASFKTTLLKVPYAFHSSQLEPVVPDIEKLASKVNFSEPRIPVLCPLEGAVIENENPFDASYLARHSRQPVNMLTALATAYRDGYISDRSIVLEVGPHPAVSGMVKPTLGQQITCVASLQRSRAPWDMLSAALKSLYDAGASINWADYQNNFPGAHTVVELPAYSWDLKEYWIQYVNDWTLRKGDPPLVINNVSKLESTTIHSVVEESGDSKKTHIVVEADIARKDLSPLVQGHEVDGIPLCTPSVYADIALTLGKYLLERHQPQQKDDMVVVSDMTVSKALILRGDGSRQPIQAHAEADWPSQSVSIKFMSFDNKGNLQEHSACVVRFKDRSHQDALQSEARNTKQKMQNLRNQVTTGESARFNRPMAYRMIRPLARFHNDYRAIDEVILNSETLEASSKISFGTVKRDGDFHTHPAVIDALTQSCGFAMNCNDHTDIDVDVYMNHGWGSLELFEPLDFEKEYTTYTQMHAGEDKLWYGDVTIFDQDRVVAFFGQIAIQGVPRRVLKVILSIESGKKGQPQRQAQDKPRNAPSQTKDSSPKPTQNKPAAKVEPPKFSTAIRIISEESGIDVSDFTDGTTFSDVGIDSLLGLTISARFQEELDIDLDFNALFFEHPTVKDLRTFLGADEDVSGSSSSAASDSGRDTTTTGSATPELQEEFAESVEVEFERALEIISEESGVARSDLDDETNFADCGVDSLLSLVIASRFQDTFGLDIAHEQLFMECQTVGDLKTMLVREMGLATPVPKPAAIPAPIVSEAVAQETVITHSDTSNIAEREQAITELVNKYTAGFKAPTSNPEGPPLSKNESVVLVTGASGGLGSHLVYALAQLEEVRTIVCLNRPNREDPTIRQYKAMRDKGIRFPEHLKSKVRIFQADTSKPKLGVPDSEYASLIQSVTHIIHNAWPMSAKRPLSGFESQFQVFRNLLDLGRECASSRPADFKFSFQMISSIGVVGQWGLAAGKTGKIVVPEERTTIDSLLGNGYAEAKWGCERMLDETLHKYTDRFRPMVVRLGQIAGSKTSGYWNPMEHFGFLIKSSQTLNALPDVDGNLNWTPVNDIADTLTDIILSDRTPYPIYHIDNPIGQQWRDVNNILSDALRIPNKVPFKQWLDMVRKAPQQDNPAALLADFLEDTYLRMACGGLVLDVKHSLEHSKSLSAVGPVSETVVRKYIHIWKEIGFLKTTAEDKAGFEAERARLWGPRV